MIKKWREVLLRYEGQAENSAVAADLKNMMPGMMVEQIAAVLLENVNIFVIFPKKNSIYMNTFIRQNQETRPVQEHQQEPMLMS